MVPVYDLGSDSKVCGDSQAKRGDLNRILHLPTYYYRYVVMPTEKEIGMNNGASNPFGLGQWEGRFSHLSTAVSVYYYGDDIVSRRTTTNKWPLVVFVAQRIFPNKHLFDCAAVVNFDSEMLRWLQLRVRNEQGNVKASTGPFQDGGRTPEALLPSSF